MSAIVSCAGLRMPEDFRARISGRRARYVCGLVPNRTVGTFQVAVGDQTASSEEPPDLSALPLLPDPLVDHDRGADEAELLAEPAFDEALVAGVELAGGEQRERRGRHGVLGAEHDLGLLAAAHGVRVL